MLSRLPAHEASGVIVSAAEDTALSAALRDVVPVVSATALVDAPPNDRVNVPALPVVTEAATVYVKVAAGRLRSPVIGSVAGVAPAVWEKLPLATDQLLPVQWPAVLKSRSSAAAISSPVKLLTTSLQSVQSTHAVILAYVFGVAWLPGLQLVQFELQPV